MTRQRRRQVGCRSVPFENYHYKRYHSQLEPCVSDVVQMREEGEHTFGLLVLLEHW